MAGERVSRYLERLRVYKHEKQPWLDLYQRLAEAYLMRKADFTQTVSPGEFMQDEVFDNTGQFAASTFASVLLSTIWPDAARTFNIVPVEQLRGLPGVEEYFRKVTAKMHTAMDRAESGLQLALMEHFLDQGVFGTSGVGVFEGPEEDPSVPVVYEAWDVKAMCISQNAQGFVDTIFLELNRTVRQVYEEYGAGKPGDRVSAKVAELYKQGKYEEKVVILKVIEPKAAEKGKKGVAAMSVRTVHIDVTNEILMREGGFEEMPVFVARMFKRVDETQGRSCGMVGLPATASLNVLSEALLVAAEKQLDPPLVVLDDGRLGGTVIDTSAGAISVFNTGGRAVNEKPIAPLFTVGEMQSAKDQKEQLISEVMQSFYLDRLLDLNNKTMMTAYETSVRNRLRGESVGSLFARQIMEVVTPVVKRTFNIMFRRGHFGIVNAGAGAELRKRWLQLTGREELMVPEVVAKAHAAGLDIYDVEYISPAQRFMQAEKLQGIMTMLDTLIAVASVRPDVLDNVDLDIVARDVYKYSGCPVASLRTVDDLKKLRAELAERQNAVAALEAGGKMADIQAKTASARAAMGTMAK